MDDEDGSSSEAMSSADSSTSLTGEESGTGSPEASTGTSNATDTEGSEASESSESSAGSEGSGPGLHTASGSVMRLPTAPIAEGNDGVGTLFIAAFATCGGGEPPIGVFALPGADLSTDAATVAWEISDLPSGPIHFALFLDDDGNADVAAPGPGPGDPSYADDVCDGVLSCMEFQIDDADLSGLELVLNMTHARC